MRTLAALALLTALALAASLDGATVAATDAACYSERDLDDIRATVIAGSKDAGQLKGPN